MHQRVNKLASRYCQSPCFFFFFFLFYMQIDDSLVGKELPAMQETLLQFLVREDPLEKEKAIHSSILV